MQNTYTIKVENPDGGDFTYNIKPLGIDVYYMLQKLLKAGKPLEAYVTMIKTLQQGVEKAGDDPSILLTDDSKYFKSLLALDSVLMDMLEPATASIKKN